MEDRVKPDNGNTFPQVYERLGRDYSGRMLLVHFYGNALVPDTEY